MNRMRRIRCTLLGHRWFSLPVPAIHLHAICKQCGSWLLYAAPPKGERT